jgi:hypothetical protein
VTTEMERGSKKKKDDLVTKETEREADAGKKRRPCGGTPCHGPRPR